MNWAREKAREIVTWIASDSKGIDIPVSMSMRRTVSIIEDRIALELSEAYRDGQMSTRHPGENQ